MMKQTEKQYSVQQVFVILVLALFMVFSMLLVLLGALGYTGLEERSARANEARILCALVRSCVKSGGVVQADGEKIITTFDYDGEIYRQYLYAHEGQLMQQFISAEFEFEPESGDVLCPAMSFAPRLEKNLLTVEMQDQTGMSYTVYEAVRTAEGGSK